MFKTNIKHSNIAVGEVRKSEDLENEYKEFSILPNKCEKLKQNELNMKSLVRGNFPNEINSRVMTSIYNYMDKYFLKYFASLSNLNDDKDSKRNFSKFYIGIQDNPSIITGIPIKKKDLAELVDGINSRIIGYLKQIRAFHTSNSNSNSKKYILLNGKKYYSFDKLLSIVFRLFKVNIHILEKKKIKIKCVKKTVHQIYKQQREYMLTTKKFKRKRNLVFNLNNKYSQSLTIMLFNYEIINSIGKFIKKSYPKFPFKIIHHILKQYIVNKDTIRQFIDEGFYVPNSIKTAVFPEEELMKNINIFLIKFREFRNVKIHKINVKKIKKPFPKKYNPLESISTTLLQINKFNNIMAENDEIEQILIEIEIPIIKDKNAIIGYFESDNNKWVFPMRKIVKMGERLSPITYKKNVKHFK